MCSAPNVYMFVYILIGTHMVPLMFLLLKGSKSKKDLKGKDKKDSKKKVKQF